MESSPEYYIECSFTDQLFDDPHEEQIKEQQKHDFAKKVAKFQRSKCGSDYEDAAGAAGKLAVKGNSFPVLLMKESGWWLSSNDCLLLRLALIALLPAANRNVNFAPELQMTSFRHTVLKN